MKRIIISIALLAVPAFLALVSFVLYEGPRMKIQPHVRTYQQIMPLPPAGTVPVNLPESQLLITNDPAPGLPALQVLEKGKVYYSYYCSFCHGDNGAGDGAVGQSYVPVPSDLRSEKIQGYSDRKLLTAMLTGPGHEPVLAQVVLPQHRWYLVHFIRTFAVRRS